MSREVSTVLRKRRLFVDNKKKKKAEDFISSLSQRKTYAEALQGNGNTAAIISSTRREGLEGQDGGDPDCPGEDGGRVEMDTC